MKNVVFITRIDGILKKRCFVDLNKVVAIGIPDDSKTFKIYFENSIWNISVEDFDYTMRYWCSDYKTIKAYNDYIHNM